VSWRSERDKQGPPKIEARHQQALSVLALAQDGALGGGFPVAYDASRKRWGALSPAVSAYVACAFARCRIEPPDWQARGHRLLRWLAGVQRRDGLIQSTTLAEPRRTGSLHATGNALIAWCHWQRAHPTSLIQRAIERGAVALFDVLSEEPRRRCASDGIAMASFLPAAEAAYGLALSAGVLRRADWREIARLHISRMLDECDDVLRGTAATPRIAHALLALLDGAGLCQTRDARERVIAALKRTTAHAGPLQRVRGRATAETRLALAVLERSLIARSLEVKALTPRRASRLNQASIKRALRRTGSPSETWPCETLADLMLATSPGL
tara:strand:- start:10946 stop:11926 length:981 start_codon:yes stop_codon:yes gene_type:complete